MQGNCSKEPFCFQKQFPQRAQLWLEIAENLAQIREPNFKVNLHRRAVRDRYNLLSSKLRRKLKDEEKKASGIETSMSEVDLLLEQLIENEDATETQQKINVEGNKRKVMEERMNAEDMQAKTMDKLGETKRRKENENH